MTRGRGGFSPRGGYRGNSRGNPWGGGGRGGYSPRGNSGGRFGSSMSGYDSRSKFSGERFPSRLDDYRRPYRDSYSGRDRSPDRKRMRTEAPSSRHDSYGGYGSSRYESYSDRRSFSGDRHSGSLSRRDDFRRPSGPPPPPRGGYRGRLSSRGSRGLKLRDRPTRRRLLESSYAVRKRAIVRSSDYARRLKISKLRSAIARGKKKDKDAEKEGSEDKEGKESKDADGDAKDDENKTEDEKSSPKKENGTDKEESGDEKVTRRPFIKLLCPHCSVKAFTFRKYDIHLSSRTHLVTMRKIAMKQKSILAQMRQAQRNTQNELEKSSDDLQPRTNFCPLCKLNYKQRKSVHQSSEAHKNMKKFLMPYCKVCNITFKSPMIYESHCCSIEHIKRKQRVENASSENSAEEDNLENFTTIDSVGDVDETEEKKEDSKEAVNVGIEQIRKVESHYCDLCKMYLPRGDESEMPKILQRHCKLRVHMTRYIRFKDLEKRAEKLQRKETAEKEAKAKKENEGDVKDEVKTEKIDGAKDSSKDDEEATEDKIWEDVDKDLGDIIAEAESGNKSSDEDEDDSHVNVERYDRFKLSEKNGEEILKDGEKADPPVNVKVDEVKEEK